MNKLHKSSRTKKLKIKISKKKKIGTWIKKAERRYQEQSGKGIEEERNRNCMEHKKPRPL